VPTGFVIRAALLLIFASAVCLGEYLLRGRTRRLRAYGLIVGAGCVGGLYGFCNDLVSGAISPHYFLLFKGVPLDAPLWARAAQVGGPAGISTGCVLGAIAAYVAHRRTPAMPLRAMLRGAWMPVALGILFSILFPLLFRSFDPLNLSRLTKHGLSPMMLPSVLTTWWEHLGVYTGSGLGFVIYLTYSRPRQVRTEESRTMEKTNPVA